MFDVWRRSFIDCAYSQAVTVAKTVVRLHGVDTYDVWI